MKNQGAPRAIYLSKAKPLQSRQAILNYFNSHDGRVNFEDELHHSFRERSTLIANQVDFGAGAVSVVEQVCVDAGLHKLTSDLRGDE